MQTVAQNLSHKSIMMISPRSSQVPKLGQNQNAESFLDFLSVLGVLSGESFGKDHS
jgi:hypothetical protein